MASSDETIKIIYVDEVLQERSTIARELRELLPSGFLVDAIDPLPQMDAYLKLLHDESVAALIVDEKLKNSGGVQYFGIQLARFIRGYMPKLPIFILTNFPGQDELDESPDEWSVDYVLDKRDLNDDKKARNLISRLVRRTTGFRDIRDHRSKRFIELLKASLVNELTESEQAEFLELQVERIGGADAQMTSHTDDELKKFEAVLESLHRLRSDLERHG